MRQITIAKTAGKFNGWPANNGLIRVWNDRIIVPFVQVGFVPGLREGQHAVDSRGYQELCHAVSANGGHTWELEKTGISWKYRGHRFGELLPLSSPLDFRNPDLVLFVQYENFNRGRSVLFHSLDRGKSWIGPHAIECEMNLCGRTDYVSLPSLNWAAFFFTTPIINGRAREGRVISLLTKDGGQTWERIGDVGSTPEFGFSIMSSTVSHGLGLITALRCSDGELGRKRGSIEIWKGCDLGDKWERLSVPCEWIEQPGFSGAVSSPGSLVSLSGRLVLTYNDRQARTACAKISCDGGKTWGDEIILRSGAGNWDIGYIRSALLPSGEILSAYYWNDDPMQERYIAGTIWTP